MGSGGGSWKENSLARIGWLRDVGDEAFILAMADHMIATPIWRRLSERTGGWMSVLG